MAEQHQRTLALFEHKISIPLAEMVREDGIAFPPCFSGFCREVAASPRYGRSIGAAIGSTRRQVRQKPVLFAILPTVRTPGFRTSPMAAETSVSRKSDAAAIIPWRGLMAAVVALAVGWGGIVYAANNSVQGAQEGRGRLRRRRADRDPDRGVQRQRAVREERRRIAGAVQHDEADDGRGGLQRHQERQGQAHRRIPDQRKRLAQGRRAGRRLDHVRHAQQQGVGRRPAAGRDHPERQRFLHRAGRGHGRQRADLCRRLHDQAGARTRPDRNRPSAIPTGCPIPPTR